MSTVSMRSVAFRYGSKTRLFDDLDLVLEPDTIYGLLGRNGAGKTTLLKLLVGLLFPAAGQIDVFGFAPEERHPDMLADFVLVPEEFETLPVTIDRYRALYGPLYPRFDGTQFSRYLGEFELDPGQKFSQMSYGQKKKALLAFALATNTRLLLLDEPTNGLDIPSKGQFRRILAGAANQERIIIVSTHQVRDMENLIDPVIILDEGRIIFDRTLEEITSALAVVQTREEPTEAIYAEKVMGGYAALRKSNGSDEHSRVDLEILFNAVTHDSASVTAAFREGVTK